MAADSKNPGMRALWRISLWGMAAAVALALAAFAARSEMGAQRPAAAVARPRRRVVRMEWAAASQGKWRNLTKRATSSFVMAQLS